MVLRSKPSTFFALTTLLVLSACTIPTNPPGTPPPETPAPAETPTQTSPPVEPSPTYTQAIETPTGVPQTPGPTVEPPDSFPPISPENSAAVEKLARVSAEGLSGFTWSSRDDWLGVTGAQGVTVYSPEEIREAGGQAPAVGRFVPAVPANPDWVFLSPGGETLGLLPGPEFLVELWDVSSGEMTGALTWTDHASPVLYGVAFSPDWSTLAWYARGTVQFMNLPGGTLGSTVHYEEFIQTVAFSEEGDFFAAATMGTVQGEFVQVVQVWDVDAGEPFATLSGHAIPATRLQFSQDGRFLAAAAIGDVIVWEVASGELLQVLGGHSNDIDEMAFTGDGQRLAVISPDGSARYWDLASGELLRSWQGMQAAISPDGLVLAFQSSAGEMMLVDPATGEELRGLETPASLSMLDFSPEGRLLAGLSPEEPAVHLWGVP